MVAKFFLVFCASSFFAKIISAQCIGNHNAGLPGSAFIPDTFPLVGPGLSYGSAYGPSCGNFAAMSGISPSNLGASYGGGLAVTSSSPISPTGLTLTSENAIEGALAVAGNLPFLGTVSLEGVYPTVGAGAVSYGCGNGEIGITAENAAPVAPAGLTPQINPAAFAPTGMASSAAISPALGYPPLSYRGIAPRAGCGPLY